MPPAEPPPSAGADPWPCPPPLPLPVAGANSSDPTSSADERRAAPELVRYAVAALNWETLGFPTFRCRAGVPASKVQQAHLDRLETLAMSAVCLGSSDPGELGRSLDKFQGHHDALCSLDELSSLVHDFKELRHSSGLLPGSLSDLPAFAAGDPSASLLQESRAASGTKVRALQASRIRWDRGPCSDPSPWVEGELLASLYDPETLRLPRGEWPDLAKAWVHATKGESLKLYKSWGDCGSLSLFLASSVAKDAWVGLFPL